MASFLNGLLDTTVTVWPYIGKANPRIPQVLLWCKYLCVRLSLPFAVLPPWCLLRIDNLYPSRYHNADTRKCVCSFYRKSLLSESLDMSIFYTLIMTEFSVIFLLYRYFIFTLCERIHPSIEIHGILLRILKKYNMKT